jgi:hypothetical protein
MASWSPELLYLRAPTLLEIQKPTSMSTYRQSEDTTTVRQPADIKKNSKPNTIQLLAKEANSTGALHYYYVYTDNKGNQTYLSAYPENSYYPWGDLVTKTGTYQQGTPDYKPSVLIGTISGSAQDVASTFQGLKSEFTRVENANIAYAGGDILHPKLDTSNSVVTTALYNCVSSSQIQLQDGKGPRSDVSLNIRAPGQSTQLLLPVNSKDTEKSSASSINQQHKSILVMYSANGAETGEIDVKKMIQELQKANYNKKDIMAVLNTVYEIQNIPETQRSRLATTAIDNANTIVAATPVANSQNTL